MPRSRFARRGPIQNPLSSLFGRWTNGAFSRNRTGLREKTRIAEMADLLETRQMLTASVSGVVWLDTGIELNDAISGQSLRIGNEDGFYQRPTAANPTFPEEKGVPNVRVFVDLNNNLQFDDGSDPNAPAEPFAFSDANGAYTIEDVAPGLANVRIDLPTAADGRTDELANGAFLTFPQFTNQPLVENSFDIELVFSGGIAPEVQTLFEQAAQRWEAIILGDLPNVVGLDGSVVDDLRINVSLEAIDGAGGIAGGTNVDAVRDIAQGGLPSEATIRIDTDDILSIQANNNFQSLITKQVGAALGTVNSVWDSLNLLDTSDPDNPVFVGTNASREYGLLLGTAIPTPVPVEQDGGAGQALANWDEETFGPELLTFTLDIGPNPISRMTIGALQDMGYVVNYAAADPYTLPPAGTPDAGTNLSGLTVVDTSSAVIAQSAPAAPTPFAALAVAPGYSVVLNSGDMVTERNFGVAPIEGIDPNNPITNRPPLAVDQTFDLVEFETFYDVNGIYPNDTAAGIWTVGRVQANDVDDPSDPEGLNLFYNIVGGNFGDELKAFGIVQDNSLETREALADILGLADPNDPALLARMGAGGDLRPGTIYVLNETMIRARIQSTTTGTTINGFDLDILVSDDDPLDAPPANPADDGNFGVDGGFVTVNARVNLVPFNRIGETDSDNNTISAVETAISNGDNSSFLNFGDPDAHSDFNIAPGAFLDDFLNRNIVGQAQFGQYGARSEEWAFVDGSIVDADDTDFFQIQLDQRTGLFLDIDAIENLGSSLNAIIRVFDANGSLVPRTSFANTGQAVSDRGYDFEFFAAPQTGGESDARNEDPSLYLDLQAGTYFIQVDNVGGTTGDYDLRILGDQRFDNSPAFNATLGAAGFHSTADIDFDGEVDSEVLGRLTEQILGLRVDGEEQFVVYLDFDGANGVDIPDAFDFDGALVRDLGAFNFDGSEDEFTPAERLAIQNIFRIVREDMASFNVNVTTDADVYEAADATNRYRIVFTDTTSDEFIGDVGSNLRILPADTTLDATGIVFTSNVLTFSPGDSYPISGRTVASAIEAGNYASNLIGLRAGLRAFSGATGGGGTTHPDAIVGVADQGLNAEFWKFGSPATGGTQYDLFTLNNSLGWRNGTTRNVMIPDQNEEDDPVFFRPVSRVEAEALGLTFDAAGQFNTEVAQQQNPDDLADRFDNFRRAIAGNGGWFGNGGSFANALDTIDENIPVPPNGNGDGDRLVSLSTLNNVTALNPLVVDPRGNQQVFGRTGIIESSPYGRTNNVGNLGNNADPVKNEADFDLYTFGLAGTSRIYVDVDEFASNINLRVQVFQVNNQNQIVNVRDISLDVDPTTGDLTDAGGVVTPAEIERARRDGVQLSGNDAYFDFGSAGGTHFVYITSDNGDTPQDNFETGWQGSYSVRVIRQTTGNGRPFALDQTEIELDEQPSAAQSPGSGFDTYNPWSRLGVVNVGRTAGANPTLADPNNPSNNSAVGQFWEFNLRSVTGRASDGSSTTLPDFSDFLHLDSATGEIFLIDPSQLDFETFPVYTLQVEIIDSGSPTLQAVVTLDIVLRDVNEKPSGEDLEVDVAENTPANTEIGQVVVSDPDDELFTFDITNVEAIGAPGTSNTRTLTPTEIVSLFRIEGDGRVLVIDPPEGLEDPEDPNVGFLDFEQYRQFIITTTATEDRDNNPNDPTEVTVTVNVTDVNEAPRFVDDRNGADAGDGYGVPEGPGSPRDPLALYEDATNGTFVFDAGYKTRQSDRTGLTPTDIGVLDDDNGLGPADVTTGPSGPNETLTFSIISEQENGGAVVPGNDAFAIDPVTGVVTVNNSDRLNYEAGTPQTFVVRLRVEDAGGLADERDIVIEVSNATPEPPVYIDATVDLQENPVFEQVVGIFTANDDDPGDVLTYRIARDANGRRLIQGVAQPGVDVSGADLDDALKIDNRGRLRVRNPRFISQDAFSQIIVTLEVTDSFGLSDTAVITINILEDVNEQPPVGTPAQQSVEIPEDTPPGTFFYQVLANDPNGAIERFRIDRSGPGGADIPFVISRDGRLRVRDALDFETQSSYTFNVDFFDNDFPVNMGTVQMTVTLTDINEPPVLNPLVFELPENSPNGTQVNVGEIVANDPEGDAVTYEIIGGNFGDAFSLQPGFTGVDLVVNNSAVLDFETRPTFDLLVRLTDDGNPQATATTTITVNLIDIGEFADIVSRNEATGEWFVYRSNGEDFSRQHFGLWSTTIDWQNVLPGDFNGDGRTDILGQNPDDGLWYVGTTTNGQLATRNWAAVWTAPERYTDIQVGDFNGDGLDDVAGFERATGLWRFNFSDGVRFNDEIQAGSEWPTAITWSNITSGDFNNNGTDEIIGLDAATGQFFRYESTGSGFQLTTWGSPIGTPTDFEDFVVADFDGDGGDDLAFRNSATGTWRIVVDEAGPNVANEWTAQWDPTVDYLYVSVGDFDGNGLFDLVGLEAGEHEWIVSLNDASGTATTSQYANWSNLATYTDFVVADFNGDGVDDVAARRDTNNSWQVGLTRTTDMRFRQRFFGVGDPLPASSYVDTLAGQFDDPGRLPLNEVPTQPVAPAPDNTPQTNGASFGVELPPLTLDQVLGDDESLGDLLASLD